MSQVLNQHLFISYSHKDTEKVKQFVHYLREQGLKIWWDEKLVPGTPAWEKDIVKAIKEAFAIVVVLSPEANNSDWVLREITMADELEKRLFPLIIAGDSTNAVPFRLITHQRLDARKDETTALNVLNKVVSSYLEELTAGEQNTIKTAETEAETKHKAQADANLLAEQKHRAGGMTQAYAKAFGNSQPQLITPDDDPETKKLRAAIYNNDWKTIQDFFSKLSDSDDREYYAAALSEWEGRPAFFDMWVKANPNCSDAWLLRGTHGVIWAWEARGHGTGDTVSEAAATLFFERLLQAQKDLEHAAELDPTDPAPYSPLITCSKGLGLEKETVFNYLNSILSLSTISWKAHAAALSRLCEKWGGSHKEMFEFARSVSAAAPEGHGIHALIPMAHHERWIFAAAFEKDYQFAENYYKQPEVKRELLNAYNRSLGSSAYRLNKFTLEQSSFFILGLYQSQSYEQAAIEIDRLANRLPKSPWEGFGNPVKYYTQIKDEVNSALGIK